MFYRLSTFLMFVIVGGCLVYFSHHLTKMFGKIDFFEKYFGGTRHGFILVGFFLMFLGSLILFGVVDLREKKIGIGNVADY